MCPCKNKPKTEESIMQGTEELPQPVTGGMAKGNQAPARTGACPYCLRKHLLKAAGYAEEIREEPDREWEREKLLQNLLLAEDHAETLGDWAFRSAIRAERIKMEDGGTPEIEPLLARAREKILESQRGAGVENKAEPARTEEH